MQTFRRIIRYLRPYYIRVVSLLFVIAGFSFFNVISIGTLMPFLNILFPPQDAELTLTLPQPVFHWWGGLLFKVKQFLILHRQQSFVILSGLILLFTFLKGFFSYLQEYLSEYIGERIALDFREQVYKHLHTLSMRFFNQISTGKTISSVTSDIDLIGKSVTAILGVILKEPLTLLGLVILLFFLNWQLALISIVVFPLGIYPVIRFNKKLKTRTLALQKSRAETMAVLQETLSGIRIVKAFVREKYEINRFYQKAKELFSNTMRIVRVHAVAGPLAEFLGAVGFVLAFAVGAYFIFQNKLTVGTLGAFLGALFSFYQPIRRLVEANSMFQRGLAAAERVFAILDTKPEIIEKPTAIALPRLRNKIVFSNVSFAYEDNRLVLDNINLEIKRNQVVAFVGPSGSGKTTLVSLIPRFYDPTSGHIYIDGHDIRNVRIDSLRNQIGIVTQETILFNDTIFNNIVYGRDISKEQVYHACRIAHAEEFILNMPNGYDTLVGERGVNLSGGQRQRIAIARAIVHEPSILILDEATSEIDTESEQLIQDALLTLMKNCTIIIIGHRLSAILPADNIFVLNNGKIVEQGTHTQLLAAGGLYARLYQNQFVGNGSP